MELELDLEGEGQALWNLSSSAKNIDCVKTFHKNYVSSKSAKKRAAKIRRQKKQPFAVIVVIV